MRLVYNITVYWLVDRVEPGRHGDLTKSFKLFMPIEIVFVSQTKTKLLKLCVCDDIPGPECLLFQNAMFKYFFSRRLTLFI